MIAREKHRASRRQFLKTVVVAGASSALAAGTGAGMLLHVRAPFDVIIRNGMMMDGLGSDPLRIDIGIRDGRILALGDLSRSEGGRTVDASGLIVSPGFIDIHSHTDSQILSRPTADSKVRQGVTTEVTGADGSSMAPVGGPSLERDLQAFRHDHGFECPYRDIAGFLSLVEERRCAQNFLTLAGLGTIRKCVVGMENRPATLDEMRLMKDGLRRAIEQGCWGVSTGLEYTPGSFATTDEITELMKIVPERYRAYHTHLRNEDNTLLEAIGEAITICKESGARLQVSHLKASFRVNWHKQKRAIEMLEEAIAGGMEVHVDRYPYIAYATTLAGLFPLWSREGGTEQFLERLQDPGALARVKEDVLKKVQGLGSWESVMITRVRKEEHKTYPGRTVARLAEELSVDPFDFTVDLMLKEEGNVGMVGFGMDEEGTELVLRWRNAMVASDAGAFAPGSTSRPHPRAYGTFPRAIGLYQRERNITTLPEMIRKMTSLPAQKLGLSDRGMIKAGAWADVVVFDYGLIRDRATFLDPHQFPEGITHVLVNGVPVVDGGVQTDALPGQVLRSG
jgi:N-acyl-D-amino-acid deacylase